MNRAWRKGAATACLAVVLLVGCQPAAVATLKPPPPTPVVGHLAPAGLSESARLVAVVDGDTIEVEIDGRRVTVRYIGIDSPEPRPEVGPPEFMAAEATIANERLVTGQDLLLERDVSDTDRFGRLLRYVWLSRSDGWLMVNRDLVRNGYAEARTYRPDTHWQDELDAAEDQARLERLGIWSR